MTPADVSSVLCMNLEQWILDWKGTNDARTNQSEDGTDTGTQSAFDSEQTRLHDGQRPTRAA